MGEITKHILNKITSGRWIQSVVFTFTYCLGILAFCVLAVMKIISTETLLAIWAGFTSMVILINEWYFKREDRKPEGQ